MTPLKTKSWLTGIMLKMDFIEQLGLIAMGILLQRRLLL